jgi:hypothetical protein
MTTKGRQMDNMTEEDKAFDARSREIDGMVTQDRLRLRGRLHVALQALFDARKALGNLQMVDVEFEGQPGHDVDAALDQARLLVGMATRAVDGITRPT